MNNIAGTPESHISKSPSRAIPDQDEPQQGQFAEPYEESQAAEPWKAVNFKPAVYEAMADVVRFKSLGNDFPEAIDLAAIEDPAALREEMARELAVEAGVTNRNSSGETRLTGLEADAEPEDSFDLAAVWARQGLRRG